MLQNLLQILRLEGGSEVPNDFFMVRVFLTPTQLEVYSTKVWKGFEDFVVLVHPPVDTVICYLPDDHRMTTLLRMNVRMLERTYAPTGRPNMEIKISVVLINGEIDFQHLVNITKIILDFVSHRIFFVGTNNSEIGLKGVYRRRLKESLWLRHYWIYNTKLLDDIKEKRSLIYGLYTVQDQN